MVPLAENQEGDEVMYELLGIYLTLFAGFAANFALLWEMKGEITANRIEFAKCPMHCKEGMKND